MPALKKIGAAALAAFGWTSGGAGAVTASYLQVAGGGGGAYNRGGGGGAGGYLTGTTSLNPTLSYTVIVGAGGTGSTSNASGSAGSNSSFTGLTASVGGGGGGNPSGFAPTTGGSGGGDYAGGSGGAAGTSGQGNAGGAGGAANTNYGAGGGGGAGAVGSAGTNTTGGNGGNGTASSISGASVTYAGGGGGSTFAGGTAGTGGTGGGGAGGAGSGAAANNGISGTANLGGGGGGGNSSGGGAGSGNGGNGGSGIVIISYAGAQQFGGGIVTSVGGNTIHTFLTSGTLSPLSSLSASYLIVAGGGGGGASSGGRGGGGGAGGMLTGSGVTIDTNSTYLVTVGAGGIAGDGSTGAGGHGGNGVNSTFSMVSTASVGGGGGGANDGTGQANGNNGGSGGGAHYNGTAGTGTSGQGNAGGTATVLPNFGSGGGGGAGAVGANGTTLVGGNGGVGLTSSISGTSTYYAGGGGGQISTGTPGTGGLGGGGAGTGVSGTANTGGGGGGLGSGAAGGAGGSGIVIISYAGATQQMAGGSVTIVGGNVIHTFTSSGYLTPLTYYSNSLRFRSSASAYLTRTAQVAGNQQKFTISAWVKRGKLGAFDWIYYENPTGGGGQNHSFFIVTDTDKLRFASNLSSTTQCELITTQVLRDPAAWYHFVCSVDTTQATASNRIVFYVNGTRVTAFDTANYPAQNTNLNINTTNPRYIGYYSAGGGYSDDYVTNYQFIDGQQLTANSFGTFNSYGVWQPINYGGSYGTNGFYLPFNAGTTSSYAAAYGGSNYIISPSGSNYNVSGDFTFETWVYFSSNPNNSTSKFIFDHRSSAGAGGITLVQESDNTWSAWNASNVFAGNTITAGKWYHMAISRQSSTQRVFLNGILTSTITDSSTYNTDQVALGTRYSGTFSLPSGAYLSNLRFVVGTALYTSNFTPSVTPLTAVTNTKLLTFQNSTIIDNSGLSNTLTNTGSLTTNVQYPFSISVFDDKSPQGNNWTPSGISLANGATYDSMTDVPTLTSATAANYCVLNPLAIGGGTISNANLTYARTSDPSGSLAGKVLTTMAADSGKWYFEYVIASSSSSIALGVTTNIQGTTNTIGGTNYVGNQSYEYCWRSNGQTINNSNFVNYGSSATNTDIVMIAFDVSGGKIWWGKNGTWFNSSDPATGTSPAFSGLSGTMMPILGIGTASASFFADGSINFGQRPFAYTPPSGFVALNTYNL